MTGFSAAPAQAAAPLPDIVVIMVDDQSIGQLDAMPYVQANIFDQGTDLINGMVPTSLCCPSRSSFFTGDYAHTTGVWTNRIERSGGYTAFQPYEPDTITVALKQTGYYTGLVGKYMNDYNSIVPDVTHVPVGWDQFEVFQPDDPDRDASYYNYKFRGTADNSIHYGSEPSDYSTDVAAQKAAEFLQHAPADQPVFLYFAPYAVHGPFSPAPRHLGTWPEETPSAIPALNEADVSDKPPWIQDLPVVNEQTMLRQFTRQHEMSMAVDEAVATIMTALGPRLSNTLIIYTSDNGLMNGAHRLADKDVPYDLATSVPMGIRWDGRIPIGSSPRVTPNVDLTATIAEAAGIRWRRDGRSMLSTARHGSVLEQIDGRDHPSYCGYRTSRYQYVEYMEGQGEEFYDYQKDPAELVNRVYDSRYATRVAKLRQRAIKACSPVPPGFQWDAEPSP